MQYSPPKQTRSVADNAGSHSGGAYGGINALRHGGITGGNPNYALSRGGGVPFPNYFNFLNDLSRGSGYGGGSGSGLGGFGGGFGGNPGAGGGFVAPIIRNYLGSLGGGVAGAGFGGLGGVGGWGGMGNPSSTPANPYTVNMTTKSPQFASGINSLYSGLASDNAANRGILNSSIKEFNTGRPGMRANLDQEAGAVNEYFNGNVLSHLNKLADRQAYNVRQGTNRALDNVKRNFNLGTMAGHTSSYLNNQALDASGNIAANAAIQRGELDRTNYLYSKEGQNKLLGARNSALDGYFKSGLQPIDWRNNVAGSEISRLGGVGGMEHGNTIYNQDTPESAMGRKLDMLTRLQQFQDTFPQQDYINPNNFNNYNGANYGINGLRRLYS